MSAAPEHGPAARLGPPLAVEVTAACNKHCLYCYQPRAAVPGHEGVLRPPAGRPQDDGREHGGQELPASALVALVERALAASGRNVVQISGGEPLLRPDLFDIVGDLRSAGRAVTLVTDGGLVTAQVAGRLKELGVAPVQPTLLAARRQVHDHLKGVPSFDATVAAIRLLREAGVPVSVSFVCTALNYQHFKEVLELCLVLGVTTVAFSRFCTAGVGAAHRDVLTPDAGMVSACLDVAAAAASKLGMRILVAISLPLCLPDAQRHAGLRFGRCSVGGQLPGYTIDPWGRLRACSVSPVILGDLKTESWSEIMQRERGRYFREVSCVPAACRGCTLEARCGGGCRESARAAYGDLDRPDPLAPGYSTHSTVK